MKPTVFAATFSFALAIGTASAAYGESIIPLMGPGKGQPVATHESPGFYTNAPVPMAMRDQPLYPNRQSSTLPQPAPDVTPTKPNASIAAAPLRVINRASIAKTKPSVELAELAPKAGTNTPSESALKITPSSETAGFIAPLPPPPNITTTPVKVLPKAVAKPVLMPQEKPKLIAKPVPAPVPKPALNTTTDIIEPGIRLITETPSPEEKLFRISKKQPLPTSPQTQVLVDAPPPVAGQAAPFVPAPQPSHLTPQSKEVLAKFPARLDTATPSAAAAKLNVSRISENIIPLAKAEPARTYESSGISIAVKGRAVDANRELSRAYDALVAGNNEAAVSIYRDLLASEPSNEEALFGLAATYHRTGAFDKARPLYAQLLKQNPTHREALNNFLVLASSEDPEAALRELERLALRNPDFSPIHAQIGMIYDRLNQPELARQHLLQAINIAPENLVYQYNLAIMLDRRGAKADATELYRRLLAAARSGAKLPANTAQLQARYNYLSNAITHDAQAMPINAH
jgi:Flp pilus assembly protein TadD